jgi:fimbrial chaperone protein
MKKIVLMAIIMSLNVVALRVELSNDTFATTGRSANRNLFVTNNSEKMIALEVYAQSRVIDSETGVDELEDVEDFLIYPNQLLLQPDEQQVVTLTWVGPQDITEEKAFRIIVEELNLSLGDDDSDEGMTVKLAALTKVVKAAYVSPEEAKSNVVISQATVIEGTDISDKKIRLTFKNDGTAHKILKQTTVKITPYNESGNSVKSESISIIPDELNGVLNILAKSERIIEIGWPKDLDIVVNRVDASL